MKYIISLLSVVVFLSACHSSKKTAEKEATATGTATLNNYTDSVSYAIGLLYGEGLKKQGFDDLNNELLVSVLRQSLDNKLNADSALITQQNASPIVNNYFVKKQKVIAQKNLAEGEAFLAANKTKKGVITTSTGLQYKVLKEGTGAKPTPSSNVTVYYEGKLLNGKVFDATKPGSPASFGLSGLISGWKEGLLLMKEGAKYRFFVPYNLAYGERGSQGAIGPNATLIFEVELVKAN